MEIANLLSKVSETMHVGRSFGPASEHDGVTIIPVALVAGGGGGGFGPTPPAPGAPSTIEGDPPTGGGGGFGTVSMPLGVYVVKNGDVRWVPAVDVTRVVIGVIGAVKLVAKLRARSRLAAGLRTGAG